ncbi:MAG TPA: hypothetical protein VFY53_12975, partial [Rhodoplanes sp.]|nr:hypothetical protein [Rhodoplanes sp.]
MPEHCLVRLLYSASRTETDLCDGKGQFEAGALPQVNLGMMQSGLLGRFSKTTDSLIPSACTAKTNEDSLDRLIELLTWYFMKLRDANPDRWDEEKGGYLRNNFGIAGHIRLLGEVCLLM